MNPTVSFYLDTRKALKDGTFPVKILIRHNRINRMYSFGVFNGLNYSLSQERYLQSTGKTPKGEPRAIFEFKMTPVREKAKQMVDEVLLKYGEFSFDSFNELLNVKKDGPLEGDPHSLWYWWEFIINEKKEIGRTGTSNVNSQGMSHLKKFYGNKPLKIEQVTVAFLQKYEKWTFSESNHVAPLSKTTLGIHLRSLRAVINRAITEKAVPEACYPFSKRAKDGGFKIPGSDNPKISLKTTELKSLFEYQPVDENERKYLSLWKFSYLCSGMNFTDICRLKWEDITGDRIIFLREKTKYTNQKEREIHITITPKIQAIIDDWSIPPKTPKSLIFGLIPVYSDPAKTIAAIKCVIKQTNRYVGKIGEKLKFSLPLTTYTARHSFATHLVTKGVPVSFLQQQLGHSSIQTTENYIGSFSDADRDKYFSMLTDL